MRDPSIPSGNPRAGAGVLAAVCALSLLLAGCLDLKAEATIAGDGSGRVALDYTLPRAMEPLDGIAGDGLPLPLRREILEERLEGSPGVSIARWTRQDLADEVRISTEIRFPGMQSLVRFLDPSGSRVKYGIEGGLRRLRVVLADGSPLPADAKAWADARYASYSLSLSVTLPVRAAEAIPGSLSSSGTAARYSVKTTELLGRSEPLTWDVSW